MCVFSEIFYYRGRKVMFLFPLLVSLSFVYSAEQHPSHPKLPLNGKVDLKTDDHILSHLNNLNHLTGYYQSTPQNATINQLARPYRSFFRNVIVKTTYLSNVSWRSAFWTLYHAHQAFANSSRAYIEDASSAVLAKYDIVMGYQDVSTFLQRLFCARYQRLINVSEEGAYLFLTFLLFKVPFENDSISSDPESVVRDLNVVAYMESFFQDDGKVNKIAIPAIKNFMIFVEQVYEVQKGKCMTNTWSNLFSAIFTKIHPNVPMGLYKRNAIFFIIEAYNLPHAYMGPGAIRVLDLKDVLQEILKKRLKNPKFTMLSDASLYVCLSYLALYTPSQ